MQQSFIMRKDDLVTLSSSRENAALDNVVAWLLDRLLSKFLSSRKLVNVSCLAQTSSSDTDDAISCGSRTAAAKTGLDRD